MKRLGISKLGLYMIHWPGFITNGWCNDAFVQGLADCQQQGLTQAVGVSNFNLGRVKTAQQILKVTLFFVYTLSAQHLGVILECGSVMLSLHVNAA